MNVINAIVTKIAIWYSVMFWQDLDYLTLVNARKTALVLILISLFHDLLSNTIIRVFPRFSTWFVLATVPCYSVAYGMNNLTGHVVFNPTETWALINFVAGALALIFGFAEIVGSLGWDAAVEMANTPPPALRPPQVIEYTLPNPEPQYDTFVPPRTWGWQCNACGARLPNATDPCWYCATHQVQHQATPTGPFVPVTRRG